eukprot:CAMPEP_0119121732 /NCGR_PEP_ID=MMETSP1310-20130426/2224_1 /TAXON_ID=464262 /ORGANISM="Genus nov. species nov., Strain RCC2339" /LENGTH=478 /DNA_ID=CAMNT_0007111309 /DNA_START=88 /DNA_END=1521 /DNA_ORIENTATION=-
MIWVVMGVIVIEGAIQFGGKIMVGGHSSDVVKQIEEDYPTFGISLVESAEGVTEISLRERLLKEGSAETIVNQFYRMRLSENRDYICVLPTTKVKSTEKKDDEDPKAGIDPYSSNEIYRTMTAMLDEIGEKCLALNEGWWTYTFCPQLSIRQFHEDRDAGKITADIQLGLAPDLARRDWRIHYDAKGNVDKSYIYEEFGGGTRCDIAPKAPRKTEVRWYCDWQAYQRNGGLPTVRFVSINEPSTCTYRILMYSSMVCNHQGLHAIMPDGDIELDHITCYAAQVEGKPFVPYDDTKQPEVKTAVDSLGKIITPPPPPPARKTKATNRMSEFTFSIPPPASQHTNAAGTSGKVTGQAGGKAAGSGPAGGNTPGKATGKALEGRTGGGAGEQGHRRPSPSPPTGYSAGTESSDLDYLRNMEEMSRATTVRLQQQKRDMEALEKQQREMEELARHLHEQYSHLAAGRTGEVRAGDDEDDRRR